MNDADLIEPVSLAEPEEASPSPAVRTVAEGLALSLRDLGVVHAFGVCGGAQALVWAAFSKHLTLLHFRHESGAAFAATEAYFSGAKPVVVFTTTGPGISNALTGLLAAKSEGAKVILVTAYASAPHRGRGGIQETSSYTMPASGLFEPGVWFDDAVVLETPAQLPQVLRRLSSGLAGPAGYVAHVSIPNAVQGAPLAGPLPDLAKPNGSAGEQRFTAGVSQAAVARCVDILSAKPFAIWAGFGARGAAAPLRRLAERAGAPVMCSPRAKGLFPETHPLFVGITGMGGHTAAAVAYMREQAPHHVLVLGTRLGEPTSFWNPGLVPAGGFIHVDIDPAVPGVGYPLAKTMAVEAEIGAFLEALLDAWPASASRPHPATLPSPHPHPDAQGTGALVRPSVLMAAIQAAVVDGTDAVVLAESGNSFTWATHHLRFSQPGRYRVSTNLGSMGHAAAGVLGAAIGRSGKSVAIVGDGAMLMNMELNTAAKANVPAVWIVLNDGRYNMCHQGMAALDMGGVADACFPVVDFAGLASAMGVPGMRVTREADLADALARAMAAAGPFVVDVLIDADQLAPTHGRNEGLRPVNAIRREEGLSFPLLSAN